MHFAVIVSTVNTHHNSFMRLAVLSALFLATQFLGSAAVAFDQLGITLGDLQGDGWQAQNIQLKIDLPLGAEMTGDLSIATLQLPAPFDRVDTGRMRCAALNYDDAGLRCTGQLQIAQLLGEKFSAQAQLDQDAVTGDLRIRLHDVALAGGRWQLDIQQQADAWTLSVQGQRVDAAAALALLRKFIPDIDYTLSGTLNLSAEMRGTAGGVNELHFNLDTDHVEFANASGTQAGEKLHMEMIGHAKQRGVDWQGDARLSLKAGNLFIDPLYLEITPITALQLASQIHWSGAAQRLRLSDVKLDQAQVAQAQADIQLRIGDTTVLESVDLQVREARLPGAYLNYIQPWLHGQVGDALETAGQFSGRYSYRAEGESTLQLQLHDMEIQDAGERFSFNKLTGTVDWGSDAATRTTTLHWAGGSVYRLALGAAQVSVLSRGAQFELREPARIPVLDGVLLLNELALSDPGDENMRFRFDGELTPVSMEAVCAALDWPKFGGQLAGRLPAARYADGTLEIGGELQVRAFEGDLAVRNLRLEQPFGRVPRLYADMTFDNLDLDALTSTFAFGKIEGRLSGHIQQLYLESWQPVAFEARFATPENDDSRHRISQKAVENLSNIGGGGVGGVLSRSFLGMFEEFPYEKLGVSCALRDGVCHMSGVEPAENGYYIVKSRFIPPRIDVVGYSDRVDWHTLIDRLKSVTLDQPPEVR